MQEIVFVTHNRGNIFSAQKYFDGIRLVTFDYELDEPRSDDLKTIATAKVRQAYALVASPALRWTPAFISKNSLSQMTAEEIENRRDTDGSVSSIQEFAA